MANLRIGAQPAPSSGSRRINTGSIDSELIDDVVFRFTRLVAMSGILFAASILIQGIAVLLGRAVLPFDAPTVGPRVLGALASLLMLLMIRLRVFSPRRVLEVAPAYELIGAACIAALEVSVRARLGGPTLTSWVPIWIFLFRVFVPYSTRKAALTAAGCLLMLPGYGLVLEGIGIPVHWNSLIIATIVSSMIAAPALLASKLLRRMQVDLTEARELGSYEIGEELGQGGMGVVCRARHRMLKREAAIKVIRPGGLADGTKALDAMRRFEREARITASLRSPNTIEIYDFGPTDDGAFYYVMELLEGLDLDQLVRKHGPQPPARVVHLLRQACRSLGEAHDAGLVHRDVKPANIFLCRMGPELDVVKVMDFGLVTDLSTQMAADGEPAPPPEISTLFPGSTEPLTMAGSVCGTPGFMAPEAVRGESTDSRGDVYAMGCVAYWLLAGRGVLKGPNMWLTMMAHLDQVPEPLSAVVPDIDPVLEAVVADCLAKDADQRPQNGEALAERLSTCADADRWTHEHARAWWQTHDAGTPARALTEGESSVTLAETVEF